MPEIKIIDWEQDKFLQDKVYGGVRGDFNDDWLQGPPPIGLQRQGAVVLNSFVANVGFIMAEFKGDHVWQPAGYSQSGKFYEGERIELKDVAFYLPFDLGPTEDLYEKQGWRKDPLANAWYWGGVVVKGKESDGFAFADFKGDHVRLCFTNEIVTGEQIVLWNNNLRFVPEERRKKYLHDHPEFNR